MHTMTEQSEPAGKYSPQDCEVVLLQDLLAVCSPLNIITSPLVPDLTALLPSTVCSVLETWNTVFLDDCSWVCAYLNYHSYNVFLYNHFSLTDALFKRHYSCRKLHTKHCKCTRINIIDELYVHD